MTPTILNSIQRNVLLIVGLIVSTWILLQAVPFLLMPDGQTAPMLGVANSLTTSAGVLFACLAVTTLIAVVIGRFVNACVGLFVLGGGLFVLDLNLSSFDALVRSGFYMSPTIELVVWGLMLFAITAAVFRFGGSLSDVHPKEDGSIPDPLFSTDAWKAAAAGLLILPLTWALIQNDDKGQVIGAMVVASMFVGLAGRLISPHVQPILLFVSPMLACAVGHVLATFMEDDVSMETLVATDYLAWSTILPFDAMAGSLLGVSMGVGWAASFLHHEDVASATAPKTGAAAVPVSTGADQGVHNVERDFKPRLESVLADLADELKVTGTIATKIHTLGKRNERTSERPDLSAECEDDDHKQMLEELVDGGFGRGDALYVGYAMMSQEPGFEGTDDGWILDMDFSHAGGHKFRVRVPIEGEGESRTLGVPDLRVRPA